MRAVLDANIWLRALIRRTAYPGQTVRAWFDGHFTLVTSEPILEEIEDVLTRPRIQARFGITSEEATALVTQIRAAADLVVITRTAQGCRDPDDDMYIETAILGKADVLVTQDDDLLTMTCRAW